MPAIVRRFLISGKVQGVYFRHSARLEAKRLSLRGFARNLPDGSVEVVAEGSGTNVDALRLWLKRGPPRARVEAVLEADAPHDANLEIPDDFAVF